jgi:hypothetical protein
MTASKGSEALAAAVDHLFVVFSSACLDASTTRSSFDANYF